MDGLLGVAGMIITSDYGSFRENSLLSTSKSRVSQTIWIYRLFVSGYEVYIMVHTCTYPNYGHLRRTIIWLVAWNMNFIFPYIGNNNHPNWLIYFRGVKTTNELHNYGKSPSLISKSTINVPFSIAMLNYQRVVYWGIIPIIKSFPDNMM